MAPTVTFSRNSNFDGEKMTFNTKNTYLKLEKNVLKPSKDWLKKISGMSIGPYTQFCVHVNPSYGMTGVFFRNKTKDPITIKTLGLTDNNNVLPADLEAYVIATNKISMVKNLSTGVTSPQKYGNGVNTISLEDNIIAVSDLADATTAPLESLTFFTNLGASHLSTSRLQKPVNIGLIILVCIIVLLFIVLLHKKGVIKTPKFIQPWVGA